MSVKIETENVKESEASAGLVRELMADDARRVLRARRCHVCD